MAEHYRERLLEETASLLTLDESLNIKLPLNGKLSHADLLVLQKQLQLHERKKKQMEQIELESNQIEQERQQNFIINRGSIHKTLELYQLAQLNKDKMDRDPAEIEYEKQADECTFQPMIDRPRKDYQQLGVEPAKNVQKEVDRMRQARKERELLNEWNSRGVPQHNILQELAQLNKYPTINCSGITMPSSFIPSQLAQGTSLQQQQEEDLTSEQSNSNNVPLLFVDVNLGPDNSDRIVVYEGQGAEELAEQFSKKHCLNKMMKLKLVEMLEEQISGLLYKIEEEEGMEEEEYEEEFEQGFNQQCF